MLETRNEANCGKEKATKLVAAAVTLLTQYTIDTAGVMIPVSQDKIGWFEGSL